MEKNDWSDIKVSLGNVSNLSGENMSYHIEIVTEQGHLYKTGNIDEHNFQCMAQQRVNDKIKELKIMRGSEKYVLSSKNISDEVKEKLQAILK